MKTRQEIINEILADHEMADPANKEATLEYALKVMSDAHLFSLAEDLNIDLFHRPFETTAPRQEVRP